MDISPVTNVKAKTSVPPIETSSPPEGTINDKPRSRWWPEDWSGVVKNDVSIPLLAGGCAFIAFVIVLNMSRQVTWTEALYAISMGLLGSSLFLLYSLIVVIGGKTYEATKVKENLARLFVGPVAGWLSYLLYVTVQHSTPQLSPDPSHQASLQPVSTIKIWLPFAAGFSADLMVGIIHQAVRAIKFTLGIEPLPQSNDNSNHRHGS